MNTLALGNVIPAIGLTRDLYPLDNAHAELTQKSRAQLNELRPAFYLLGIEASILT